MTENKGDLISRKALKEKLSGKEYITYTPHKHYKFNDYLTISQAPNDIFDGFLNNNEMIL